MNKYLSSLAIAAALLFFAAVQTPSQNDPPAEAVLKKVANKLATVKLLGYKYKTELGYEGQPKYESSSAYVEMRPADGTSEFRHQFSNDERLAVYNGSESFVADKKTRKLKVKNNPSRQYFGGFMSLLNSPLMFKYGLPKVIANKAIPKTLSMVKISGRDHYRLTFTLSKAFIDPAGEYHEVKDAGDSIYQLTIDKKTLLPVEVLWTNTKNKDFERTIFTEMTEKPAKPDALSWYFSSYQDEYELQQPLKLIETGQTAPDLKLPLLGSDSNISLEQYKGKVVLLEFWIINCVYCVEAVPKLNAISEKFKDRELELISINMHDPASAIEVVKKKSKAEYMILTGGDSIATAYGVGAYPAIVLIGKDGKVLYSSRGLDEKELEAAIDSALR